MSAITTSPVPFVRRLRIRNYKSIGKCDVSFGPLSVLVGRNSAGKSNLLDSLRFVSDGLQTSLDHAIKSRGGIDAVRRKSTGHPRNFAIELELSSSGGMARYGFEIAAREKGAFTVKREALTLPTASYRIRDGRFEHSTEAELPVSHDRLYLVTAASVPVFRELYDALSAMGFYNLNPDEVKELQSPDSGELLRRDGSNIASVIERIRIDRPDSFERLSSYLRAIVPGISGVERAALGPKETLEFRQTVKGSTHPWRFYAASVSDGTLRALGILTAVMQLAGRTSPIRFVGIEEPETALHPAAAGALMDALREAASHTQVVLTSHSGVLLEQIDLSADALLAVVASEGKTQIAPIDSASRQAIADHLYTAGELQRMDQLQPDPAEIARQEQLRLFDDDQTAQ